MQVNPDRRPAIEQGLGQAFRETLARQRHAGGARTCVETRSKPVHHRNRDQARDATPVLPPVKAAQIVGAHDPDETHRRTALAKIRDRFIGVMRADLRLEPDHLDARVPRHVARRNNPLLERSEAARIFERIAWRDEPPNPIEVEALHGKETSAEMGAVRRIERAAEQTDPHPAPMRRQTNNVPMRWLLAAVQAHGRKLGERRFHQDFTALSVRCHARDI